MLCVYVHIPMYICVNIAYSCIYCVYKYKYKYEYKIYIYISSYAILCYGMLRYVILCYVML